MLKAPGLVKTYGRVVGLDGVDLELYPGEVLAIIGDNGAGKSTADQVPHRGRDPDAGEIELNGKPVQFKRPQDAKHPGSRRSTRALAVSPALDVASNLYLGRELRRPGSPAACLPRAGHQADAPERQGLPTRDSGISTLQDVTVPSRPCRAVSVRRSRSARRGIRLQGEWCSTSRPRRSGVRETNQVLELIRRLRDGGLPVILVSHNMPNVFDVADRIHIQRLGKRAAVITPKTHSMTEAVAIMTGAATA